VISTKITWSREISRIVYKRCASCHREGGAAFSLMKYEEARPWAKAIKEEVLGRRMPPWNAVKGFGEFKDDQGLTQEQITLIAEWVEGGAPEGDPAYLPPKPRVHGAEQPALGAPVRVSSGFVVRSTAQFAAIQPCKLNPGESLQVTAVKPDGTVEPLLWVEEFNPSYDQPYWFANPLRLPAGSRIDISGPGSVTLFP
jgi:hypothetical protein